MNAVPLRMEDLPHYTYDDYIQWEGRWDSRKDRVLKYQLYEKMAVKYFCIVAPETNSAEVFVLQKEKYRETEAFEQGRISFDLGPCQIQFDFSTIFNR